MSDKRSVLPNFGVNQACADRQNFAAARPAKLAFSRTRKLSRGGFTTLRASRVRRRQVAPARQDRNAGETDGQKKYRTQVFEAVPRR
jgi:hypothetical protein